MKKILLIIALSLSVVMCKSQSDTKSSVGKDTKNVTNNTSIDKEVNLQKYFNDSNTQGSITIYDYKNKKWILDVDNVDEISPIMMSYIDNKCEPVGSKCLTIIKSKSGFHLITKPFNVDTFTKHYYNIEIHKDNPTNLYIP